MKIYTKKGDKGQTDLLSKRVAKDDLRIEVNGTIDTSLALISLAKQYVLDNEDIKVLNRIYDNISTLSYEIVLDDETMLISYSDVAWVENTIDKYSSLLEPVKSFVRFDSSLAAAYLNLLRTSVRELERRLTTLKNHAPLNMRSLEYINRVSDLLFVLARKNN